MLLLMMNVLYFNVSISEASEQARYYYYYYYYYYYWLNHTFKNVRVYAV